MASRYKLRREELNITTLSYPHISHVVASDWFRKVLVQIHT